LFSGVKNRNNDYRLLFIQLGKGEKNGDGRINKKEIIGPFERGVEKKRPR